MAKTKIGSVEFVDYTGSFPNLCSGELTIKVNGRPRTLKPFDDDFFMCLVAA